MSERGSATAARERPAPAAAAAPGAVKPRPRRPPAEPSGPQRPRAIWHPVPVTEVAILAGAVALLYGFSQGKDGVVPMFVGLGVSALAVTELSAREHFTGFRSHALLLALVPVVVLEGLLFGLVGVSGPLLLAIAVPVFVSLAFVLRGRYREAREDRPRPR